MEFSVTGCPKELDASGKRKSTTCVDFRKNGPDIALLSTVLLVDTCRSQKHQKIDTKPLLPQQTATLNLKEFCSG
jgi:hypothetical protein